MASALLFEPLHLRDVVLRNRIVVSPMCQYSSDDGFANDWHFVHLGARAVGGAGLVFTEATAVTPEGRISPRDLGLWKDEHIAPLARAVAFVAEHGAVPGIQLAHAGRKASTVEPWKGNAWIAPNDGGWVPVAPSALPFSESATTPAALDEAGIRRIVVAFGAAARRAREAGFRVIEIHAAHGYLLHEFLSPLTNRRTDAWGGSFEGRTRAVLEVTRAVRREWPKELPLVVRISATDWVEGGWDLEQSIALAKVLKTEGVDLLDCSSGGAVPGAKIPAGPGYQTAFAAKIRAESGMATGAVGLIRSAHQAEHILRTGQADVVLLARELLRDPHWPLTAARKLGVSAAAPWPRQYERARD